MQRSVVFAICFGLLAVPAASLAQQPENTVLNEKDTKQLTPHVWALFGNPNIGIVVGSKGTLVVDTGLGRRNGLTIAGVASRLSKSSRWPLSRNVGSCWACQGPRAAHTT